MCVIVKIRGIVCGKCRNAAQIMPKRCKRDRPRRLGLYRRSGLHSMPVSIRQISSQTVSLYHTGANRSSRAPITAHQTPRRPPADSMSAAPAIIPLVHPHRIRAIRSHEQPPTVSSINRLQRSRQTGAVCLLSGSDSSFHATPLHMQKIRSSLHHSGLCFLRFCAIQFSPADLFLKYSG